MSSKAAASRAMNRALLALLRYISDGNPPTSDTRRKVHYLRRHHYLKRKGTTYTITNKGRNALKAETVWNLQIPTMANWDQKWRLVLFDIPVAKKKRRDAFRLRLKELGLTLYQHSVWIYPYPLEKEIETVANFYALDRCISFATADHISGDKALRRYYKLD